MALPSYSTGTVSIDAGGTTVTGSGTIWTGGNAREGDDFVVDGVLARIVDVVSASKLAITKWTGGAVSGGSYEILQNSSRRVEYVQITDDLGKQVAALNTEGFYHFVPPGATEPDPSLGDDGQYAFQATTGKLWLKSGGVWVFVGIYKGINPRGAWNNATSYAINDIVSLNGNSYMATAANTNSQPPSANWMLLASKGDKGDQGLQGRSYGATSATSLTIGTGSKTFTTQAGLAFVVGDRVHVGAIGNELNWMEGFVTAYSGTSMTVAVGDIDGSGTFTLWGIGLTGKPGLGDGDMKGANNLADLTDAAKARANLGVGIIAGFRNKIINGDFDYWQRGLSQTASGYGSADRWFSLFITSSLTLSQSAFAAGQTNVPGNPTYFARAIVSSVANSGAFARIVQAVEGVRTLAGRTATLTFYAKADAARSIAASIDQNLGTGGAPSGTVNGNGVKFDLTTSWKRFSQTFSIPSIAGKTIGTDGNDSLNVLFWFDAGANFASRSASIGQQSGTFDIAHVSLVPGDATTEDDPFSPRHPQQELLLCQRYFCLQATNIRGYSLGGSVEESFVYFPTHMRINPTTNLISGGTISNCVVELGSSPTRRGTQVRATIAGTGNFIATNGLMSSDAEV